MMFSCSNPPSTRQPGKETKEMKNRFSLSPKRIHISEIVLCIRGVYISRYKYLVCAVCCLVCANVECEHIWNVRMCKKHIRTMCLWRFNQSLISKIRQKPQMQPNRFVSRDSFSIGIWDNSVCLWGRKHQSSYYPNTLNPCVCVVSVCVCTSSMGIGNRIGNGNIIQNHSPNFGIDFHWSGEFE